MNTAINKSAYRVALGIALVTSLLLIWMSLGVGIIGADGDRANIMFFGVIAVGILGAIIARLRPRGMSRTLIAMLLTQTIIATYAVTAGLGMPYSGPLEIMLLNGFFIVMYAASAWLFQRAALG